MTKTDKSAVFHKTMLDAKYAAQISDTTPWIFDPGEDVGPYANAIAYVSEDAACEAQRKWRRALGFNELTGERT